jgi:TRAP-type C4-dicarboxylate transport system permease small subunit
MRDYLLILDRVLLWTATVALIAIMLLTVVSVTGRYVFSAPIPDDLVFSEMLLVVAVFLPLAYVQRKNEHVNVTLFTDLLPLRWQQVCELVGLAIGCVFFGTLAAATFTDFQQAWDVGAYVDGPLKLPEWPSRFAVFFGITMFFVRLVRDFFVGLYRLTIDPPV